MRPTGARRIRIIALGPSGTTEHEAGMDDSYDVAIIGGGVLGLSSAMHLLRAHPEPPAGDPA